MTERDPVAGDDFAGGYGGEGIGCGNCDGGWNHGCCDDMCYACNEPEWCENAVPCRCCNPLGDWQ